MIAEAQGVEVRSATTGGHGSPRLVESHTVVKGPASPGLTGPPGLAARQVCKPPRVPGTGRSSVQLTKPLKVLLLFGLPPQIGRQALRPQRVSHESSQGTLGVCSESSGPGPETQLGLSITRSPTVDVKSVVCPKGLVAILSPQGPVRFSFRGPGSGSGVGELTLGSFSPEVNPERRFSTIHPIRSLLVVGETLVFLGGVMTETHVR